METVKKFRVGQMWSEDFDYEGMMKCGLKTKPTDSLKKLEKLYDSLEDVNYHTCNTSLWDAINILRAGGTDITKEIELFHLACQKEIDSWTE
jgi:hypothetical protein